MLSGHVDATPRGRIPVGRVVLATHVEEGHLDMSVFGATARDGVVVVARVLQVFSVGIVGNFFVGVALHELVVCCVDCAALLLLGGAVLLEAFGLLVEGIDLRHFLREVAEGPDEVAFFRSN